MAKWVYDQGSGELDYPTLGFRADPGDILDATAAPDGRWSLNGNQSAAETVTRYTLGGDPSYVEPGDGHVLRWVDAENAYEPAAPVDLLADEDFAAGLSASYAPRFLTAATAANTKPLMMAIARGTADTSWLDISDSTGNGPDEFCYLTTLDIAARFPELTVVYHLLDVSGAGASWLPAQTIQTGTGPRTLHVWNAAASGQSTGYFTRADRWLLLLATNPNLVTVNHGHNQGDPTSPDAVRGPDAQRTSYLTLVEELAQRLPDAGIVLMSQNPTTLTGRTAWQAIKAQVVEQIAAQRGWGFIDVHQAFVDYATEHGVTIDSLLVDMIHPSPAAQAAIWAPLIIAALQVQPGAASLTRSPSPLTVASRNLLGNNFDFSQWSGSLPDGWSAINATISKDTTDVETGSWAAKITPTGSGESGLEFAGTPAALGFPGAVAGQMITMAVRYKAVTGAQTGSAIITDQRGSASRARQDIGPTDRFTWAFVTMRLVDPTTILSFKLLGRVSGSGTSPYTFDRAFATIGPMPLAGSAAAQPGPTGPAGSSPGQRDHLSTFGSNPMVTALASGGAAGPFAAANDAQLVKIRPHRNMTITKLIWRCSTGGGNYDVAIYDAAGTRLWSKGSTASPLSGTTVTETVSPAVSLIAGDYYWLAIAADGTTFAPRGQTLQDGEYGREMDGTYGARKAGSAFPLPNPITIPTPSSSRIPVIVLAEA